MILEQRDVLIQGITGREGTFQSRLMIEYGTKVVAGVTPGKGGERINGVPVYDTVKEALLKHPSIGYSVSFVPPASSFDSILESIEAEMPLIVAITEGIPVKDTLWLVNYAKTKLSKLIGPNCPGVLVPRKFKLGIIPSDVFIPGNVGLVSRSGTLTYEVGNALATEGLGVTAAFGVGGDTIVGTSILDVAEIFEKDPDTKTIVVLGEVGGTMEEDLAVAISKGIITKPVVAYIVGLTAPPGKRMGHAGAIVSDGSGTAQDKLDQLKNTGVSIAQRIHDIAAILKNA